MSNTRTSKFPSGRLRDPLWSDFIVTVKGKKVICKFCRELVSCKIGRLRNHDKKCSKKLQKLSQPSFVSVSTSPSLTSTSKSLPSLCSLVSHKDGPTIPKRSKYDHFMSRLMTFPAEEELEAIGKQWAKFFYSSRLSFSIAENEDFQKAIAMMRPDLEVGTKVITEQKLSGKYLDDILEEIENEVKISLLGKKLVLAQDGWSNSNDQTVITTCLNYPGRSFLHDAVDVDMKHAVFCVDLVKKSIIEVETKYECTVIGFVSDNDDMDQVRDLLKSWRPSLIVYGCSVHHMNFLVNVAFASIDIKVKERLDEVQKYFRNHRDTAALLKKMGGTIPQLYNESQCNSSDNRAFYETFIENRNKYISISEEVELPPSITQSIENGSLLSEAKYMLEILDKIKEAVDILQSDHTDFCLTVKTWQRLIEDDKFPDTFKTALRQRYKETITPYHIIAYMVGKEQQDPDLSHEQYEDARKFFRKTYPSLFVFLAGYEIKDATLFSESVFESNIKNILQPDKYWQWVGKVSALPAAKEFSVLMEKIFTCPSSPINLKKICLNLGFDHSNVKNRLSNKRVAKLVKIYNALRTDMKPLSHNFDILDFDNRMR